eukprot:286565-Chlamydomonas_euryale.AAC.1
MVACMGIMRDAVCGRPGNMDVQTGVPAAHAHAGSDSSGRQRAGGAARRSVAKDDANLWFLFCMTRRCAFVNTVPASPRGMSTMT